MLHATYHSCALLDSDQLSERFSNTTREMKGTRFLNVGSIENIAEIRRNKRTKLP